jgi:hypothetical protein
MPCCVPSTHFSEIPARPDGSAVRACCRRHCQYLRFFTPDHEKCRDGQISRHNRRKAFHSFDTLTVMLTAKRRYPHNCGGSGDTDTTVPSARSPQPMPGEEAQKPHQRRDSGKKSPSVLQRNLRPPKETFFGVPSVVPIVSDTRLQCRDYSKAHDRAFPQLWACLAPSSVPAIRNASLAREAHHQPTVESPCLCQARRLDPHQCSHRLTSFRSLSCRLRSLQLDGE